LPEVSRTSEHDDDNGRTDTGRDQMGAKEPAMDDRDRVAVTARRPDPWLEERVTRGSWAPHPFTSRTRRCPSPQSAARRRYMQVVHPSATHANPCPRPTCSWANARRLAYPRSRAISRRASEVAARVASATSQSPTATRAHPISSMPSSSTTPSS